MDGLKRLAQAEWLWGLAFVGVCVLVGIGKMKPESVELMLFAIIGRSSVKAPSKETE